MIDLKSEMAPLWASLRPPSPGQPRVVLFAAAQRGEGTSTVAREFARFAASRSRGHVWLVDLDLAQASQHRAITAQSVLYGPLGGPSAATPDGSTFFTVRPRASAPDGRPWPDDRYFVAYPVGGARLWVTRFRREALSAGQRPRLTSDSRYWSALRRHAEWVVVDAPVGDQSLAALAVAPFADATVLVVAPDQGDVAATAALKEAVIKAGGHCAGLVFNRADVRRPRFLRGAAP